jgi:ribosome biogenesis GTPase / thiamine phosphate phosphatase
VSSTLPAGTSGWRPRVASCAPTGTRTGHVVAVRDGLVDVEVGVRRVRASYDGDLLAAVARDARAAPRVGDQVRLRCWVDGRTTVQRVLARALPDAG